MDFSSLHTSQSLASNQRGEMFCFAVVILGSLSGNDGNGNENITFFKIFLKFFLFNKLK